MRRPDDLSRALHRTVELRLALLAERGHAFAEVGAAVAGGDEIVDRAGWQPAVLREPAQRLARGANASAAHWRRSCAPSPGRRASIAGAFGDARHEAQCRQPRAHRSGGPSAADLWSAPGRSDRRGAHSWPPTDNCRACGRSGRRTAPAACTRADRRPARGRSRRRRRRRRPARWSARGRARADRRWRRAGARRRARRSADEKSRNWLMSVPAAKASPAARSTSTRTAWSALTASIAARQRVRTSPRSARCAPAAD